jgi:hypothetical protein
MYNTRARAMAAIIQSSFGPVVLAALLNEPQIDSSVPQEAQDFLTLASVVRQTVRRLRGVGRLEV